jgi:hypothetical protein
MGDNSALYNFGGAMRSEFVAVALACSVLAAMPSIAADKKPAKTIPPGQQCLDSFKDKLKDPESGRVISFNKPVLVYTATNDYGGRIQGKALCVEANGMWKRDAESEISQASKLAYDAATANLACANSGKTQCNEGPETLGAALKALGYK